MLTVLVGHASAPAQTPDPQPANGSFEKLDTRTGLPDGWLPWNPGRNLTAYTLAVAHSGVAAASVTDDNGTDSQGLRSPRVPVVAGRTYRATGHVWIDELQAGSFALYLEFWAGGQRLVNSATSTSERDRWVELKVQQVAPAGAEEATVLIYGSSATIGHAYFDAISLQENAP